MNRTEKLGGTLGILLALALSPGWMILYFGLRPYVHLEALLFGGITAVIEWMRFFLMALQLEFFFVLLLPCVACILANTLTLKIFYRMGVSLARWIQTERSKNRAAGRNKPQEA